jgi:predicted alpha/beta-fold hydrolase
LSGRVSAGTFRAPWWLPGGDVQTIYASLRPRGRRTAVRREEWTTPDDDRIVVDFLAAGNARAPLVVMLHGLEGSSESHYAHALFDALARRGWRGAVPHFRGCGGIANRLPRAYHSGDTAELDWLLARFTGIAAGAPLLVSGVSLGGNVLLKWLGEAGESGRDVVAAAAAVSAPVDLAAAGAALERGFNRVYARYFLATMKPKAFATLARHPGLFDGARLARARTLRDFDDLVTAPLHGFLDCADYWKRASAKPLLPRVRVPTLVVNARNDPFLPACHLPDADQLSDAITAEYPDTGGHVGFVSGPFPGHFGWLPDRIIAFFDAALGASRA